MKPVLFFIPGTESGLPAYGAFLVLALLCSWLVLLRTGKGVGIAADRLTSSFIWSVAIAFVVARSHWLLEHRAELDWPAGVLGFQSGELSPWLAIVCTLAVGFMYAFRYRLGRFRWLDAAMPALLVGIGLERFGAFLAGTAFGHYCDPTFLFAVEYPRDSPAFIFHMDAIRGLSQADERSLPVHPSQLYAAAWAFIGAGMAAVSFRRREAVPGALGVRLLQFFLFGRFVVENGFRADGSPWLGFDTVFAIVAIVGLEIAWRIRAANPTAEPQMVKRGASTGRGRDRKSQGPKPGRTKKRKKGKGKR